MTVLPLVLSLLLTLAPAASPEEGLRPGARAAGILTRWDARRAHAWATGDTAALRRLYVPGSEAQQADVSMLRAWHRQGLRVEDMAMQLLAVRVESASPGRWVLDVVDRMTGAVVVGAAAHRALPLDRPSRHRVVLEEVEGRWRVAAVS